MPSLIYRMCLWRTLLTLFLLRTVVEPEVRADTCSRRKLTLRPGAQARITVILGLRAEAESRMCTGPMSDFALQNIAVLQWAAERFNAAKFVSGVQLGLDVFDDCDIERYSVAAALDGRSDIPYTQEHCGRDNDTVLHVGIIGTSASETTEAVLEVLKGTETLVLSPYATSPVLSGSPNFYRTVPADDLQAQAIVKLMKRLDWTYVAIVHTCDIYGREGVRQIKRLAEQNGICVDTVIGLQEDQTDYTQVKMNLTSQLLATKDGTLGVVFFGGLQFARALLHQMNMAAAKDSRLRQIYWIMSDAVGTRLDALSELDIIGNRTMTLSTFSMDVDGASEFVRDKWQRVLSGSPAQDELEELMACSGKAEVPPWNPDYMASVIDAVYMYGTALGRKQRFYCPGLQGLCDVLVENFKPDMVSLNYTTLKKNLTVRQFAEANRSVSFDANGDLLSPLNMPLYTLHQYVYFDRQNSYFRKLGEFINDELVVERETESLILSYPRSECGSSCSTCIDAASIPYAYVHGDAFVVAMFSLHETDPNNSFKCGKFRTQSTDIITLEAFLYTVGVVSQQLNKETGVTLGAIVLDDCYSSSRASHIMAQLLSRETGFRDPDSHHLLDVSRILAFVGDLSSSSMISVAYLLTKLHIPMISSSSSSPDLDDRINFPYFLRTVPSDEKQAMAMVNVIKRMGWRYVSVLYVKNNYGSKGVEAFLRLANASDICVAASPLGLSETVGNQQELYRHLSSLRNQGSKLVVYFGTIKKITDFLQVMQLQYKQIDVRFDFRFLSSEDWGDNQFIIDTAPDVTKGSITLVNQVSVIKDGSFADYLRTLNPDETTRNPWLPEYWEENFQCDLQITSTNQYHKACPQSIFLNETSIRGFLVNHRIVHIVDAVKGLGKGLIKAKTELCNFDQFPCANYFKTINSVVGYIRDVTLTEDGVDRRLFLSDGNGNVGFRIVNIQRTESQILEYVEVGSYDDNTLALDQDRLIFYDTSDSPVSKIDGTCGMKCSHCSNMSKIIEIIQETTTPMSRAISEFSHQTYTLIGVMAFVLVVMVFFFVIALCCFRNRMADLERQLKQTSRHNGHNDAAYSSAQRSLMYPDMQFADASPSGGTDAEWKEAQYHLKKLSPNGLVNKGFISNEISLRTTEELNVSGNTRRLSSGSSENNRRLQTMPSQSSYKKLNPNHSFKGLLDAANVSPLKKQPRTQLAVPPCRPELPPRTEEPQRSQKFPSDLATPNSLDRGQHPRERVRRGLRSPRKSSLFPVSYSGAFVGGNAASPNDRPRDMPSYMTFSSGSLHGTNQTSPTTLVSVGGSMEKISRV